jgi:hypothetical protein
VFPDIEICRQGIQPRGARRSPASLFHLMRRAGTAALNANRGTCRVTTAPAVMARLLHETDDGHVPIPVHRFHERRLKLRLALDERARISARRKRSLAHRGHHLQSPLLRAAHIVSNLGGDTWQTVRPAKARRSKTQCRRENTKGESFTIGCSRVVEPVR